jgi:hypothetical protein
MCRRRTPSFERPVEARRTSLQHIWREEIKPRLRHVTKMVPEGTSLPESPETAPVPEESPKLISSSHAGSQKQFLFAAAAETTCGAK